MKDTRDLRAKFEAECVSLDFHPEAAERCRFIEGAYKHDYMNKIWSGYQRGYKAALQAALQAQQPATFIKVGSQIRHEGDDRWYESDGLYDNDPESETVRYLYVKTQQPAQEPVGEVQHYAAPANLPAYVNMKWYGKPPKNGTKLYAKPPAQEPKIVMGSAIQKLGTKLADLLDEDQFKECEDLLLAIAVQPAQEPVAEKATVWFNALSRIATLLEMPEDQPIIQAVDVLQAMLEQPAIDTNNAAVAAIQYALKDDSPMEFLKCWNEGNFAALRKEWENVPDEVFIGADPLFAKTTSKPQTSVQCRGCWELGTACGKCAKCEASKPKFKEVKL